jgi:hypothetical protein
MIIIKDDYINILSLIQIIEMEGNSEILFDLKMQAERELKKRISEADPIWLYDIVLFLRKNARKEMK